MSKFLTGAGLDDAICDVIWKAEETLMIVSPYIKLDDYFKKLFDKHQNNPHIHLMIVFGKNEGRIRKSLSKNDFDYFKEFLNVSIVYAPNLHAKYYGNEKEGIITSINLYDYSFKNNIEFGVFFKVNFLNSFGASVDNTAWEECLEIAENNEVIFIKRPVFENKKFVINLGKNYIKSDILFDSTEQFYGTKRAGAEKKKLSDFPEELELGSKVMTRPVREQEEKNDKKKEKRLDGFCIRTGERIPFNTRSPLSLEAWKVWAVYSNEDWPENYCHKTGVKSGGKTSMRKPIL